MLDEWHIKGTYFGAGNNQALGGTLAVAEDGTIRFMPRDGTSFYVGKFRDTKVTDRLGSIPRRLTFADSASFETPDNDMVDKIQWALGSHTKLSKSLFFVEQLERSWKLALLSVIIALTTGFLAYRVGVPLVAEGVANGLPQSVLNDTSERYHDFLINKQLKPPHLSAAQMDEVRSDFDRLLALTDTDDEYQLIFRHAPNNMANAFALPDGTIVVTDDLVKLATHPDQVTAVLAHEIGHVHRRHSVRGILEASALSLVLVFIVGDTSGIADLLVSAPAVLAVTANSRRFEREADDFAITLLHKAEIGPHHLADILELMMQSCDEKCSGGGFLDTHPSTDERANNIRAARP